MHAEAAATESEHRAGPIWPWIVIGLAIFGLFAVAGFAMRGAAPANPSDTAYERARAEARLKNLADLRAANDTALHAPPSWVNKSKGIVRIPIDRAIELEIATLNASKPRPAYPIQTPAPATAPAPAAGASPTPSATPSAPAGASPAPAPH